MLTAPIISTKPAVQDRTGSCRLDVHDAMSPGSLRIKHKTSVRLPARFEGRHCQPAVTLLLDGGNRKFSCAQQVFVRRLTVGGREMGNSDTVGRRLTFVAQEKRGLAQLTQPELTGRYMASLSRTYSSHAILQNVCISMHHSPRPLQNRLTVGERGPLRDVPLMDRYCSSLAAKHI